MNHDPPGWTFIGPYIVPRPPRLLIAEIQRRVAAHFSFISYDLISPCRSRALVAARHVAMYLARRHTDRSYPEIGRRFGRDHSSVISAVRGIEARRMVDPGLDDTIRALAAELRA